MKAEKALICGAFCATLVVGITILEEKLLAQSVNYLGFRVFHEMKNKTKNPIISYLSLATILSMLFSGSGGATAEQFRMVLGYTKYNLRDSPRLFKDYLKKIDYENNDYTFMEASAELVHCDFPVSPEYKAVVKDSYFSVISNVDFSNHSIVVSNVLNKWVMKKTRNRIPDFLETDLENTTKLLLMSAVYFRGNWKFPFPRKNTTLKEFYNRGNMSLAKKVVMMNQEAQLLFTRGETYRAVQMPFRGDDYSMVIILPETVNGVQALQYSLKEENFQHLLWNMHEATVNIYLPKFGLKFSADLNNILNTLGLQTVWSSKADFSWISSKPGLTLSRVRHAVEVEVNEGGALPYTPRPPYSTPSPLQVDTMGTIIELFMADRPFLFYILDMESEMVIIEGRVDEL